MTMQRFRGMSRLFSFAAVVAVLAFGGWLIWIFIDNVREADASIMVGLIGLLGMLTAALIAHYQTKKREINARLFDDKSKGYMHMIDLLFDFIIKGKKGEELTEEQTLEGMLKFKKALIVWGGPKVIEAWNSFEVNSASERTPHDMVREMEGILRAMRKDLGHDDSALKFGSLWGLMLVAEDKNAAFEVEDETRAA